MCCEYMRDCRKFVLTIECLVIFEYLFAALTALCNEQRWCTSSILYLALTANIYLSLFNREPRAHMIRTSRGFVANNTNKQIPWTNNRIQIIWREGDIYIMSVRPVILELQIAIWRHEITYIATIYECGGVAKGRSNVFG